MQHFCPPCPACPPEKIIKYKKTTFLSTLSGYKKVKFAKIFCPSSSVCPEKSSHILNRIG